MSKEKDPNREAAQQRLNMGKDPGSYYADLSDQYKKQQASGSGGSGKGCLGVMLVPFAAYGAFRPTQFFLS